MSAAQLGIALGTADILAVAWNRAIARGFLAGDDAEITGTVAARFIPRRERFPMLHFYTVVHTTVFAIGTATRRTQTHETAVGVRTLSRRMAGVSTHFAFIHIWK